MEVSRINLVTGGSGYLGEALIPKLEGKIRVVARNEGKLVALKQKFPDIEIFTGDIADMWTVKRVMRGVDKVYHLAAMKSVDIAERQPFECIQTNINGTLNLLTESLNTKPELFLMISTDKAAQVTGVYGATKFLGERLMKEAEMANPFTRYRIVRYGNVLYSTGSVLCKWRDAMIKGDGVKITKPEMTRFFWTKDQAVDLIFDCIGNAEDATPYVPEMKSMRMGDLLEAMMKKYGKVKCEVIGNRGGENLHETIDGKVFSNEVEQFSIDEIKELI
jgi:UDP-N-acetylglucosamine 4,6-dehydratase/5-epimerase